MTRSVKFQVTRPKNLITKRTSILLQIPYKMTLDLRFKTNSVRIWKVLPACRHSAAPTTAQHHAVCINQQGQVLTPCAAHSNEDITARLMKAGQYRAANKWLLTRLYCAAPPAFIIRFPAVPGAKFRGKSRGKALPGGRRSVSVCLLNRRFGMV